MAENKDHENKDKHEQKQDQEHAEKAHAEHGKEQPAHEKKQHDILKEKDAKIAEMTDKYLRALAELDNFRKRVGKDKEDFVKYTRGDTARVVLPVLDNLDRAVHATKITDNVESLRKGVELVIKQFEDTLRELGVKEIEVKGLFKPELHQVMHKEPRSDKPEGEILEVYQKGYMIDDKVIRPALVKVACKEEKKEEPKAHPPSPAASADKGPPSAASASDKSSADKPADKSPETKG